MLDGFFNIWFPDLYDRIQLSDKQLKAEKRKQCLSCRHCYTSKCKRCKLKNCANCPCDVILCDLGIECRLPCNHHEIEIVFGDTYNKKNKEVCA